MTFIQVIESTCSVCGKTKPIEEFYCAGHYCKKCYAKYYQEHKDERKEYQKKRFDSLSKKRRKELLEKGKKYYWDNREELNKKSRERYRKLKGITK